MFVFAVFIEIVDAVFLEEAGNEVQIGFTVLDAVAAFPFFVLQAKVVAVGRNACIFKDIFDNVLGVFVLEDAAVLLQGQKLSERNDLAAVQIFEAAFAGVLKFPDDAVKVALFYSIFKEHCEYLLGYRSVPSSLI